MKTLRLMRLAQRLASSTEGGEPPEVRVYRVGDEIVARATLGGKVVGLASWERSGKYLQGKDLWVKKSMRRRGVATLMYKAVEKKGFILEPSDQLTPEGQGFWKSRGLSESEAERRYVAPGAHPNDVLFGD